MLLATAKQTNQVVDWDIARRRRNEVKSLVKNAKSNFVKDNLQEYKNDSTKFWKSLNNILPSKKKLKCNIISLKNSDGSLSVNNKDAANEINHFVMKTIF